MRDARRKMGKGHRAGWKKEQNKKARNKATNPQPLPGMRAATASLAVPTETPQQKRELTHQDEIEFRGLSTDAVIARAGLAIGIVLTVVGATQMIPLEINVAFYVVGLASILYAFWKWEKLKDCRKASKIILLGLVSIIYCLILVFPVSRQYANEISIHVTFKETPLISWWRKQIATHDIAGFRNYLLRLDMPVPEQIPPISIGTGPLSGESGSVTEPNHAIYRHELLIGKAEISDRKNFTLLYGNYVVDQILTARKEAAQIAILMMIAEAEGFGNEVDDVMAGQLSSSTRAAASSTG